MGRYSGSSTCISSTLHYMRVRLLPLVSLLGILFATHVTWADELAQEVRSILSNRCFACHGPDEEERQGGFRLDLRESYLAEADSGEPPVVPGKPDQSELLRRLKSLDASEQMPPPDFAGRLGDSEIAKVRQWIADGAELPEHWSFVAPAKPSLPNLSEDQYHSWKYHPVDQFVRWQQLQQDFSPSPQAKRSELLRRLSLDLTGLPPTPEEVASFDQNTSPFAYEQEVERLLSSPRFGEHWARKWLDLARYADSAGYADDPPRTIWAYRDWVIRAINDNQTIDQFTIDQLAGDLLENPTDAQRIATAFHRNTLTNNEGGTNDEEFRNVAVVDRVNTTMAVWMGVTMACAQCHTHKYDPFTHEEYFQLFAIFNQSEDADRRNESPTLPVFTQKQKFHKKEWELQLLDLEQQLATISDSDREEFEKWTTHLSAPSWNVFPIDGLTSKSGVTFQKQEDQSWLTESKEPSAKDEYAAELLVTPEARAISALKLEVLADPSFPQSGPGLANGNFVLTNVSASLIPNAAQLPSAQFLRVEHPGKSKILSLAEVEVFSAGSNIAGAGKAKQSTTDFRGPANLAIDGNTNGDYNGAMSTTHTSISDDPWWELDLGAEHPVDSLRVWNRTDNNLQSRLVGARVQLLAADRTVLFETKIEKAKNSYAPKISLARVVNFTAAFADFSQSGFPAEHTIDDNAESGWAVAGALGKSHSLTLTLAKPLRVTEASRLIISLQQNSKYEKHVIGRIRISTTDSNSLQAWAALTDEMRAIQQLAVEKRTPEQRQQLLEFYSREISKSKAPTRRQLAQLSKRLKELKPETTVPVMQDRPNDKQRKTFVQIRGNYKSLGQEVHAGTPEVFHAQPDTPKLDRLALAQWLVDRENPLTARVWVNRLWESLFGIGIVRSSEEFGSQGDRPTHPQLLDWLAVELMQSGWDRKAILRLLVTSETYKQTSQVTPGNLARDKDNIWLARGPRVRLSAEMVRDQSLAAAGLLSSKMFGAPVRPPQPDLELKAAFGGATDWKPSPGEDRYRRGVYTQWRRSSPYPSMVTFDAPSREVCTLRRDRTNTPLQALVTLNDPGFVEAAQALARRVVLHENADQTDAQQVSRMFELVTSRPPGTNELSALMGLFEKAKTQLAADPDAAMKLATDPLGPLPEEANPIELSAYTALCNVLLNLDEVLMKR